MSAKLSKNLPKRCTNEKLKSKRARNAAKNTAAKALRIKEQNNREIVNSQRGYTGKDIDNAQRQEHGKQYRAYKKGLLNY